MDRGATVHGIAKSQTRPNISTQPETHLLFLAYLDDMAGGCGGGKIVERYLGI